MFLPHNCPSVSICPGPLARKIPSLYEPCVSDKLLGKGFFGLSLHVQAEAWHLLAPKNMVAAQFLQAHRLD